MIARTGVEPRVWMTGTSSPCLSVWKPVAVDRDTLAGRGHAGETPDGSLWWAHERLHRRVLEDHVTRGSVGATERAELEARTLHETNPSRFAALWDEHRERIADWHAAVGHHDRPARGGPFAWFWRRQSSRDAVG